MAGKFKKNTLKLELKVFYQTYTARKPPKSPPAGTKWCRSLLLAMLFAATAYHSYAAGGDKSAKRVFWSLVTLIFDLDIQTIALYLDHYSSW